jgi:ATP-binding cassette, subfamily B, bacterial CvaB/MchF/RaxB
MFSRFRYLPLVRQAEATECGHACLAMIAYWFGHRIDLVSLRLSHATSANGLSVHSMALVAEQLGLKARALRLEPQHLAHLRMPAVLHWDMNHATTATSSPASIPWTRSASCSPRACCSP